MHATEQEAEEADEEAEVVVTDGSDIPDVRFARTP